MGDKECPKSLQVYQAFAQNHQANLKPVERAVFLAILSYANNETLEAWVGVNKISEEHVRTDQANVRRAMASLTEKGYLQPLGYKQVIDKDGKPYTAFCRRVVLPSRIECRAPRKASNPVGSNGKRSKRSIVEDGGDVKSTSHTLTPHVKSTCRTPATHVKSTCPQMLKQHPAAGCSDMPGHVNSTYITPHPKLPTKLLNNKGAAGELVEELRGHGISGTTLAKVADVPGLTPLDVRLAAMEMWSRANVANPAGWLVSRLLGFHPDRRPRITPQMVVKQLAGQLRSVNGRAIPPHRLTWNLEGLHIHSATEELVETLKEITPAMLELNSADEGRSAPRQPQATVEKTRRLAAAVG